MKLRVNFNWKLTLFVVFFLPVLLYLGFWQLDRAQEKREMQQAQQALVQQPAVNYDELATGQWQNYRNVSVSGEFRQEQWLLDNQIYQGKFGYEVIQAFRTHSGHTLLVSRGWIAGSLDRTQWPSVPMVAGETDIHGYLYQPTQAFQLQEENTTQQWPRVIQSANLEKLYKDLGENDKIAPLFLLRLNAADASLLAAHWQIINVQPEKHTAYAVQWFGMALLLVILFMAVSIRRTVNPS